MLTFRDCQKGSKRYRITMRTSHIVMNIADRHVQGIILVLAGSNGYGGLVAAQDDGDESGTMCGLIFSDYVLKSVNVSQSENDYTMRHTACS